MTKVQFDVIRKLACAYNHEWAVGLNFAEKWPKDAPPEEQTTSRGEWSRERAMPATYTRNGGKLSEEQLAEMRAWRKWCNLHDRIEQGYVPSFDELERLAERLFHDENFPTTCYVALRHETCTGRTRWAVSDRGEVRFEFRRNETIANYSNGLSNHVHRNALLCRAEVYTTRSGQRVAMVDVLLPMDQWGNADADILGDGQYSHRERVLGALIAAGCSRHEAERALTMGATARQRAHDWTLGE